MQAETLFQRVYTADRQSGDLLHAGRSLTWIGACDHGLFRYRDALQVWLEARRLSERVADWVNLGSLGVNISSLYFVMGDLDAAADAAERALADANRGSFTDGIARAQIQLGIVRARQGRLEESAAAMDRAIVMAEREGNLSTAAEAWDHYGEELLAHGALRDADRALTEASGCERCTGWLSSIAPTTISEGCGYSREMRHPLCICWMQRSNQDIILTAGSHFGPCATPVARHSSRWGALLKRSASFEPL